ncbi:hypothetical protein [Dactylosporangium sp. NPDC048998]|uniref:hypothetical protein n=1 Tax=Dactylosporangium sp. NPDC048998 TaxID=3363976 RepID=UPI00371A7D81
MEMYRHITAAVIAAAVLVLGAGCADTAAEETAAGASACAAALEPVAGQAQGSELRASLASLVAALKQYNAGDGYDHVDTVLKASRETTDALIKSCP